MNIFKIFEKVNPVLRSQEQYKNMAKKRGLLSLTEASEDMLNVDFSETVLFDDTDLVVESFDDLSESKERLVWVNKRNLNNRTVKHEEIQKWIQQSQNGMDKLTVNHSANLEDNIGEMILTRYDEKTGELFGKGAILRTENSKLQDLKNAVKETDGKFKVGYSPEFGALSYSNNEYSNTTYYGMTLTASPSASQTIVNNTILSENVGEDEESAEPVNSSEIAPQTEPVEEPKEPENTEVKELTEKLNKAEKNYKTEIKKLEEQIKDLTLIAETLVKNNKDITEAISNNSKSIIKINEKKNIKTII